MIKSKIDHIPYASARCEVIRNPYAFPRQDTIHVLSFKLIVHPYVPLKHCSNGSLNLIAVCSWSSSPPTLMAQRLSPRCEVYLVHYHVTIQYSSRHSIHIFEFRLRDCSERISSFKSVGHISNGGGLSISPSLVKRYGKCILP